MSNVAKGGRSVSVVLNPRNQTLESLNALVAHITRMAGCDPCGRVAVLNIDFLGDPPPPLAQHGVISLVDKVATH